MRNVILIFIDSLRKDHVGIYGNDWIQTPNLDAFSKKSLNFSQAYPESLATIPIRRSTMTGKRSYPFRDWKPSLGDFISAPGWQPLSDDDIPLSEILFEANYRTALLTDVYHLFKPSMNYHRGFCEFRFIRGQELDLMDSSRPELDLDHYLTPKMRGLVSEYQTRQYLTNVRHRKGEQDHFSPMVFQEAIDWLERNQDAESFYMHVDSFDPHEPWDPPKKYWSLYDDPNYSGREIICPDYGDPLSFMSQEELNHVRAMYAGEVTMVDHWFGKFIAKIEELGLEKDTMIIMISDHGHPLGEHNIIRKNPAAMYPEQLDIPLMIRHPDGKGAGQFVDGYVYNHDVFKTIINFTGAEIDYEVPSLDLMNMERGRDYATCAFKGITWAKTDDYAFFCQMDGSDSHLFDLKEDPGQFNNIAADRPQVVKKMFDLIKKDANGPLPDFSSLQGQLTAPRFSTALSIAK